MKTLIRLKIENILNLDSVHSYCFIDPRKNGVRMKFAFTSPATLSQIYEIKSLSSHIIKVGYSKSKKLDELYSTIPGVTVYLDCSTKLIM
jgi:hypothetical protein